MFWLEQHKHKKPNLITKPLLCHLYAVVELSEQCDEKQNAKIWSQEIAYKKLVLNTYNLNIPLKLP